MTGLPWELPKGWRWAKVADIAHRDAATVRPADDPHRSSNYLGLEHVQPGQRNEPPENLVRGESVRSSCTTFSPGQVLYAKLRPYLNKVVLCSRTGVASTEFVPLTVHEDELEGAFLAHYLRSPAFVSYASTHTTGSRMPRARMSEFWSAPVPIPPLAEQRRILAKIDEVMAKVEEARGLSHQAELQAAAVLEAETHRVFSECLSSVRDDVTLGDIIADARYGTSQKCGDEPVGTPILRMGNIQAGRLDTSELKYCIIPERHREKMLLQRGDLLVNRTNSAELVGKCAVFDLHGEYGLASYLIRLRLDQQRVVPRFVARYINSTLGRQYMLRERTQALGQANVNLKTLRAMPIPMPPMSDQSTMLAYLESLEQRTGSLSELQRQAKAELDQLSVSVLDKAFRGLL